jgi:hypothetical protein
LEKVEAFEEEARALAAVVEQLRDRTSIFKEQKRQLVQLLKQAIREDAAKRRAAAAGSGVTAALAAAMGHQLPPASGIAVQPTPSSSPSAASAGTDASAAVPAVGLGAGGTGIPKRVAAASPIGGTSDVGKSSFPGLAGTTSGVAEEFAPTAVSTAPQLPTAVPSMHSLPAAFLPYAAGGHEAPVVPPRYSGAPPSLMPAEPLAGFDDGWGHPAFAGGPPRYLRAAHGPAAHLDRARAFSGLLPDSGPEFAHQPATDPHRRFGGVAGSQDTPANIPFRGLPLAGLWPPRGLPGSTTRAAAWDGPLDGDGGSAAMLGPTPRLVPERTAPVTSHTTASRPLTEPAIRYAAEAGPSARFGVAQGTITTPGVEGPTFTGTSRPHDILAAGTRLSEGWVGCGEEAGAHQLSSGRHGRSSFEAGDSGSCGGRGSLDGKFGGPRGVPPPVPGRGRAPDGELDPRRWDSRADADHGVGHSWLPAGSVAGGVGHAAADRLRFPGDHHGPSAIGLPRPGPPRGALAGYAFGNSFADTRFDASGRGQWPGPSFPTRLSGRPPFDAPPRR